VRATRADAAVSIRSTVPVEAAGRDAATATTGASVLASVAWKKASTFVPQLCVLVQSIVAARFLGPSRRGLQSFIAFVETALITALSGGFSGTLTPAVGAHS
jgi:hypothetical protein